MNGRRIAFWSAQVALLGAVVALTARGLSRHWEQLAGMHVSLAIRPAWIGLAIAIVLATYGLLIEAWRRLIVGWGQRLSYRDALRIWTIANLGRYIPGKVWAIAGLAVLARRAGVAGWAAAGSAVIMQGIVVGTGAAVVVAFLPGNLHVAWLAGALGLAGITVLVPAWPAAVRRLGGWTRQPDLRPLGWHAVGMSAVVALLSWVGYGCAFWALVRGVLPAGTLTIPLAIGAFAAGYIAGLLAAFAPGGIGVREGVIGPLVVGTLGGPGALVAAAAQRILFTLTEGISALAGLALGGLGRTDDVD